MTYENSAALAQYTHIKESQEQTEKEIKARMDACQIDQDLLVNFIENDEEEHPLPKNMTGFGKYQFCFNLFVKNVWMTYMILITCVGPNTAVNCKVSTDMVSVVYNTVRMNSQS